MNAIGSNQAVAKLDDVARSLIAAYERIGIVVALVRPHAGNEVRVIAPMEEMPSVAEMLYRGADAMAWHAGSAKVKRVQ